MARGIYRRDFQRRPSRPSIAAAFPGSAPTSNTAVANIAYKLLDFTSSTLHQSAAFATELKAIYSYPVHQNNTTTSKSYEADIYYGNIQKNMGVAGKAEISYIDTSTISSRQSAALNDVTKLLDAWVLAQNNVLITLTDVIRYLDTASLTKHQSVAASDIIVNKDLTLVGQHTGVALLKQQGYLAGFSVNIINHIPANKEIIDYISTHIGQIRSISFVSSESNLYTSRLAANNTSAMRFFENAYKTGQAHLVQNIPVNRLNAAITRDTIGLLNGSKLSSNNRYISAAAISFMNYVSDKKILPYNDYYLVHMQQGIAFKDKLSALTNFNIYFITNANTNLALAISPSMLTSIRNVNGVVETAIYPLLKYTPAIQTTFNPKWLIPVSSQNMNLVKVATDFYGAFGSDFYGESAPTIYTKP